MLSIVVPITLMGGRLDRLRSWLEDSHNFDVEIILIHDFQDQQTQDELESLLLEVRNPNILLRSGTWKSPGLARNHGLSMATQPNIIFWDCDDSPELKNVCEAIFDSNNEFDLIIGNFQIVKEKGEIIDIQNSDKLDQIALNPGMWRMVIKREFLRDLSFNSLRMGEDQIFLSKLVSKSPRIQSVPTVFYRYFRNNPTQLTQNSHALEDLKRIPMYWEAIPSELESNMRNFLRIMYVKQFISLLFRFPAYGVFCFGKLYAINRRRDLHDQSLFSVFFFVFRQRAFSN